MESLFHLLDSTTAAKFVKRFYNAWLALDRSTLPKPLREQVELRVSQINGCGFCTDLHTREAAAAGESSVRLNQVAAWRESTVFAEAELCHCAQPRGFLPARHVRRADSGLIGDHEPRPGHGRSIRAGPRALRTSAMARARARIAT
ncbi:carboxymuconolactone decarboxylase family protein [Nonomuraea sp. KM88]|uniref:carboxymuconolactone decarboxylase family protein n=1 Tax=Nonomuraea sp. KM88 TaxID=3457427 RepID=UPI003FCCD51C